MIVKNVINEELLTISEAKELLDRIKEERAEDVEEEHLCEGAVHTDHRGS